MRRTKSTGNRQTSNKSYSAPALEKGMDIIETLADAESGLTISEISARLKRPMSELFRIIVVMQQRGWLQKDAESARYSVTYHVLRLAHRSTPAQTLTTAATPVMHELSIRINQSCHLVVRSGSEGLVILRQENQRRHANLSVRTGAIIDLASSCSGLVILAHLDAEEFDRAIPRGKRSPRLTATLNRIRKRGYEIHRSPVTAGVTDIGCPIFGFDGKVVAALTVPYLRVLDNSVPTTIEQTRQHIQQATRRISQALGWKA
jgi:DNA-binding IclR family transcriptional regulator